MSSGKSPLDDLKLLDQRDSQDMLGNIERQWRDTVDVQPWLPTVATQANQAKQIAQECLGLSIIIYAGPVLGSAAQHWKQAFNQYAKQLAWATELTETEIQSWTGQPERKLYSVIELQSRLDPAPVQQLFETAERQLSGRRPAPHVVQVEGKTVREQQQWAAALGDFVAVYTALLSGIDPAIINGEV